MGLYREPDPLASLLAREQQRVVDSLMRFSNGEGADAVADARRVLGALRDTEAAVLYPAFSRVSLRPETERLLDDCRDGRAQQLAALDALAHKRSGRLRKLAVVQLADLIHHFGQQHIGLLIPVLSSQLPRQLYRSIVQAFTSHYEGAFDQGAQAHAARRRQRTINANV